jgi:hypothetical protein
MLIEKTILLFTKIIAVYCLNHMRHINTFGGLLKHVAKRQECALQDCHSRRTCTWRSPL